MSWCWRARWGRVKVRRFLSVVDEVVRVEADKRDAAAVVDGRVFHFGAQGVEVLHGAAELFEPRKRGLVRRSNEGPRLVQPSQIRAQQRKSDLVHTRKVAEL